MNSNEREERLKQIRERNKWRLREGGNHHTYAKDTDFLLSLLDGQTEADPEERKCVACGKPAWAHACDRPPLSHSCADAATQMRDQCVAKVKTMKAEYDSKWQEVAHPEKGGAITSQSWQHYSNAANEIITALESLTLDVEQKEAK